MTESIRQRIAEIQESKQELTGEKRREIEAELTSLVLRLSWAKYEPDDGQMYLF